MIRQHDPFNFAVIFDMDGVLVDSNPYHKKALKKFFHEYGIALPEDELKTKIFGRTNKDWMRHLFSGNISAEEIQQYSEEKERLYRDIHAPHIKPIKGLLDFLEKLKVNNIPRAIATSASAANAEFVMNRTGITNYFTTVIDESFVESSKPDPEIYLKTAKILGFPPERCIVIEDSLSGVEAAKNAGCKVIGITTTHSRQELNTTDMVIDNFTQLQLNDLKTFFIEEKI